MIMLISLVMMVVQVGLRLTKLLVILAIAVGSVLAMLIGAAIVWRWNRRHADPQLSSIAA
jgi:membrane protein DedA with SNARE-associated domain